jgi:hypothetical protein
VTLAEPLSPPPPAAPAAPPRLFRTYRGPVCPYCGAALHPEEMTAGEQLCFSCAESFEATPFSPPSPYLPPLALAAAGPAGGTPCAAAGS